MSKSSTTHTILHAPVPSCALADHACFHTLLIHIRLHHPTPLLSSDLIAMASNLLAMASDSDSPRLWDLWDMLSRPGSSAGCSPPSSLQRSASSPSNASKPKVALVVSSVTDSTMGCPLKRNVWTGRKHVQYTPSDIQTNLANSLQWFMFCLPELVFGPPLLDVHQGTTKMRMRMSPSGLSAGSAQAAGSCFSTPAPLHGWMMCDSSGKCVESKVEAYGSPWKPAANDVAPLWGIYVGIKLDE